MPGSMTVMNKLICKIVHNAYIKLKVYAMQYILTESQSNSQTNTTDCIESLSYRCRSKVGTIMATLPHACVIHQHRDRLAQHTVEAAYNESPGTFKSDLLYPEFVQSVAPIIMIFFFFRLLHYNRHVLSLSVSVSLSLTHTHTHTHARATTCKRARINRRQ